MPVNHASPAPVANRGGRAERLLISVMNTTLSASRPQRDALRRLLEGDDAQHAAALEQMQRPQASDLLKQSEREAGPSSQSTRREVARDAARDRVREGRQAFRERLRELREGGANRGSESPVAKSQRGERDARGRQATTARDGSNQPSKTDAESKTTTPPPSKPTTQASPQGGGAGQTAAQNARALASALPAPAAANPATGPERADVSSVSVVRGAVSARVTSAAVARPVEAGATKPNANVQPVSPAERSAKAEGGSAFRASGARPAQSAVSDSNFERLVRVMRRQISENRSHTVMRLDPPELGKLRLQMDLHRDALTLRVDTSTELAHRLLSQDLEKLRQGLESAGVHLERVEIRPPEAGSETHQQDASHTADQRQPGGHGSAETDPEPQRSQGREAGPIESAEPDSNGHTSEPAAESLVNIIA